MSYPKIDPMKKRKQHLRNFYGLARDAHWRKIEHAVKAIRKSLKSQHWEANQHFVYQFELKTGILFGYQGVDTSQLQDIALLEQRATVWVQQMQALFEQRVSVGGMVIGVFYFDRWLNCVCDGWLFKWFLKDGVLGNADKDHRGGVGRQFSTSDWQQFHRLLDYPLATGQYFVHFFVEGAAPQPKSNTLCLVQIVDSRIMLGKAAMSRRLFFRLRDYMLKDGPYRHIIIKYQHRHYNHVYKEFMYTLDEQ